jgi:hypothetical protein
MTHHWTQAQIEDRNELIIRLRARGVYQKQTANGLGTLSFAMLDGLGFAIQALERRVSHRVAMRAMLSVLRAGRLV